MSFDTNTDFVVNYESAKLDASVYVISSSLVGIINIRLTSPYDTSHFIEE
jgi:hypothetical protein